MHRGQKKYPDSHKVNHHLFYANQDTFPLPVRERVGRFKYVEPERMQEEYQSVLSQLDAEIAQAGEKEEF